MNHDEFYVVVTSYNARYKSHITNLQSVALDKSTKGEDFAKSVEHGPFKIYKLHDMTHFNVAFLAIVMAEMRKYEEGRGFLRDLLDNCSSRRASPPLDEFTKVFLATAMAKMRKNEAGQEFLRDLLETSSSQCVVQPPKDYASLKQSLDDLVEHHRQTAKGGVNVKDRVKDFEELQKPTK